MLECRVKKVAVGSYLACVWETNTDSKTVMRRILTKENKEDFYTLIKTLYKVDEFDLDHLWKINADYLAHEIPGVNGECIHPVNFAKNNIFNTVIDLNDSHKWTREQIADWLETLDNMPKFDLEQGVLQSDSTFNFF